MTLHLAIAAVEGLYGAARVRMDVAYKVKADDNAIVVDASSTAGGSLVEVFTSLALREFGDDAVALRRATHMRAGEKRGGRQRRPAAEAAGGDAMTAIDPSIIDAIPQEALSQAFFRELLGPKCPGFLIVCSARLATIRGAG